MDENSRPRVPADNVLFMSDHIRLIASAQIDGAGAFVSNQGFRTLVRSATGVLQLTLCGCYDPCQLNVQATLNGSAAGSIAVELATDTSSAITIHTFDDTGAAANLSFSLNVDLLPASACAGCDDDDDE